MGSIIFFQNDLTFVAMTGVFFARFLSLFISVLFMLECCQFNDIFKYEKIIKMRQYSKNGLNGRW